MKEAWQALNCSSVFADSRLWNNQVAALLSNYAEILNYFPEFLQGSNASRIGPVDSGKRLSDMRGPEWMLKQVGAVMPMEQLAANRRGWIILASIFMGFLAKFPYRKHLI